MTSVVDSGTVELADGRTLRLQGVSVPAASVRPGEFEPQLRRFLATALVGRRVWVFADEGTGDGVWAVVRTQLDGPSINEQVLARGLALFHCSSPKVAEMARLQAASKQAQRQGRGWFAASPARLTELPYLNGAVLGLHYEDPRATYHRQIDELADAGFHHVCLLFSAFLADVRAHEIDRSRPRCVCDERLLETIRYAKGKGMSVMLLPIVLLIEAADDEWRGTLRPADEDAFWRSYDSFLCHYLDLAEVTGVDLFSIGSEFSSLEDRTETWRRLIANARGRYRGFLTYSANWDHVHVPRFFGQLDLVGMTAYFSLTDDNDPSPEELVEAWRDIGQNLERSIGAIGKPVVFTELGYPSQDGANSDPWNYLMNKGTIDLGEQAMCFAAFREAAPEMAFLRGAYFYDYFDAGGPEDPSYSPRGKPAMAHWRAWAR